MCDICMQPSSGIPSFTLYRGSLLALLIGTAVAVWLLVQPPGSDSAAALRPQVLTATAPPATSTLAPGQTPSTRATQPAAGTAAATVAGTPGATATVRPTTAATVAGGGGSYTVRSGDTLGGICASQRPALANADCVSQLRTLNNLTGDNINIDQALRLP